jgi:transposase
MKVKKYNKEFQVEAVRLLLSSPDRTQKEIAEDLGVSVYTLRQWRAKYKHELQGAFQDRLKKLEPDKRIKELERENERLKRERDILKKAMAIFSQQQ